MRAGATPPGPAINDRRPRTEGLDERADLVLGDPTGHEDHGRTDVEERAAALEGVVEDVVARPVAGAEERVGAGVEHEVGHALGRRRR